MKDNRTPKARRLEADVRRQWPHRAPLVHFGGESQPDGQGRVRVEVRLGYLRVESFPQADYHSEDFHATEVHHVLADAGTGALLEVID